jgi:cytosine/adenosine deaminase-related metal-dependent hydrolase
MSNSIDVLLTSAHLITMANNDPRLRHDEAVAIQAGKILDIGPRSLLEARYTPHQRLDLSHHLVMPGLINCHGHIPMISYAGKMPTGLPFADVLFGYMLPLEWHFCRYPEFVYLSTLLGLEELRSQGVTTSAEMYYFTADMARAFEESGLRGILGETIMTEMPAPSGMSATAALDYAVALAARYAGHARISIALAPHSPYAVNDHGLSQIAMMARQERLPVLMHLNETPVEVARPKPDQGTHLPRNSFYACRPGVSAAPVEHLQSLGFLDQPALTVAHAIYLTESEQAILASKGIGVAFNGVCNSEIGLDVAPVADLRRQGVAVGVASDGPMTNDRVDLISQLKPCLGLIRSKYHDSLALSEYDLVRMVTREAATALHQEQTIGSLEIGKRADLIALDLAPCPRARNYLRNDNPYSYLVKLASSRDVSLTMVEGQILPPLDTAKISQQLEPIWQEIQDWQGAPPHKR